MLTLLQFELLNSGGVHRYRQLINIIFISCFKINLIIMINLW